jgi:hypothetical protein
MVTGMQKNHVTVNGLVAKPSKEVSLRIKSLLERPNHTNHYRFRHSRKAAWGLNWLICIDEMILQQKSFQHLGYCYRNNIIEKMVPERLQKDRRDIDEFG